MTIEATILEELQAMRASIDNLATTVHAYADKADHFTALVLLLLDRSGVDPLEIERAKRLANGHSDPPPRTQ